MASGAAHGGPGGDRSRRRAAERPVLHTYLQCTAPKLITVCAPKKNFYSFWNFESGVAGSGRTRGELSKTVEFAGLGNEVFQLEPPKNSF